MDNKTRTTAILLVGGVLVLGAVPLVLLAVAPGSAGYAALGAAVLALGLVVALVVHRFAVPQPAPPAEASEHGVERMIGDRAARDAFWFVVIALPLVNVVVLLGDLPAPQPIWFAVGALVALAGTRFVHTRRMG